MASNGEKAAVALVFGLAAGYVAGILTAPKSGAETREDLKNAAEKFKKEATAKLALLKDDLDKLIDEATVRAKDLSGRAQKELEDLVGKAKAAQSKSKDVLSAVKSGDSDDKDLQKALADVKNAKKNLANYLKSS